MVRRGEVRLYETGISYYGRTYEEGKKIVFKDALRAFFCILKYNNSTFAHLFKYIFIGFLVALSQFIVIISLKNIFDYNNIINQNIGYAISVECSILAGFVLHSKFTWIFKFKNFFDIIKRFVFFQLITSIF